MKPLVPPKPVLDTTGSQWRYYWLAGSAYVAGLACTAGGVIHTLDATGRSTEFNLFGLCFIWFGAAFWGIGKLTNNALKARAALTKRLNEQDARIRLLEAQIAALTTQSPSPKA